MRDVCNVFFYWHLCLLIWLELTKLVATGQCKMLETVKVPLQLCLHPQKDPKPRAHTLGRLCAILRVRQGAGTSKNCLVKAKVFGGP